MNYGFSKVYHLSTVVLPHNHCIQTPCNWCKTYRSNTNKYSIQSMPIHISDEGNSLTFQVQSDRPQKAIIETRRAPPQAPAAFPQIQAFSGHKKMANTIHSQVRKE